MSALGFGPSLGVRGSAAAAGFDFGGGVLPPGARLTRASTGSRFDAGGVLRIEAADVPRFDHDPASHRLRGLLIEPARTNEVVMSETPTDAAWTRSAGLAIASDGASAPDGTGGAEPIGDTADTAAHWVLQFFGTTASRTISVFIGKDAVPRTTRFPIVRASGSTSDLALDTSTGAFSIGGAAFEGEVRDCGAFRRVALRCGISERIMLFPAAGADAGWLNSPAATGSVIAWGFQAEQGASATSYIPTGAAPATRSADVLTLDWRRWGVPDGPLGIRTTFDDGSTQEHEIEVVDGRAAVPTTLARPWVRSIRRR